VINGVWTVLGGLRFRSTRVKPDGTVRLGYTGAGFPGHPAFRFDEAKNAWYAVVPAAECDVIVEISHQAGYHGHLWLLAARWQLAAAHLRSGRFLGRL
jgi:hypothetical protein